MFIYETRDSSNNEVLNVMVNSNKPAEEGITPDVVITKTGTTATVSINGSATTQPATTTTAGVVKQVPSDASVSTVAGLVAALKLAGIIEDAE